MDTNYQLFQGDCLEVMKQTTDGSVDLVLTDPPYGTNLTPQWKNGKFKNTKVLNDGSLEWLPGFVNEVYRVSKNVVCVFCGWQNIDKFKIEFERKFIIKNVLVWNKDWLGMGNNYRPNYELILLMCKTNVKTKSNNKSNILTYRRLSPQKMLHVCEKPVNLLEDLIQELSEEGNVILDCFMGSGSTGVACANTGRKFTGIELDRGYFEVAQKRIEEAYNK